MSDCIVVDGFYEDFGKVMERASELDYGEFSFQGTVYRDISPSYTPSAYARLSGALGFPVIPVIEYFRRYEKGVKHSTFIHSDYGIAEYSAVCSLKNGNGQLRTWNPRRLLALDGMDESHWALDESFDMVENRCVVFPSSVFHSRYPKEWEADEARLVQVFFFNRRQEG